MRRLLLALAVVALPLLARAQSPAAASPETPAQPAAKAEPKPEPNAKPEAKADEPAKDKKWLERARGGEVLYATLQTSMGDLTVRLLTREAPRTVENFVALAAGEKTWVHPRTGQKSTRPLYDGTVFHRVIPNFMIQGGDPRGDGTGGPGYEFEDEFKSGRTFDKPCLMAMANSGPNTNGSQFFITEVPTHHLDGHHTIFGEGIKGCELVAKIARAGATTPVVLKKVVLSVKAP